MNDDPDPADSTPPQEPIEKAQAQQETVVSDTVDEATSPPEQPDAEPRHHPEIIGPYRILEVLGEGGMGVVYLAEQSEPVNRKVALKLVRTSFQTADAVARFSAERQAMARLSHPNVAQLYDAGTTDDGFPYFAMEHVPGDTLTAHCDRQRLTVEQRLRLFQRICEGVQHAHQKGVLHRDLKPANLLVAEVGGRAVPKVIDFGIAKAVDEPLTDDAELTGLRAIGTPAYMSPEARLGSADVDTRTDVYSLGVVLYELLAGVRPHQLAGGALVSRIEAPAERAQAKKPSTRVSSLDAGTAGEVADKRRMDPAALTKRVRGDLDWIVMKAITDEPERRYASAAELAADIERHLGHEPVTATPPSLRYRTGKFVRRNRAGVAAAALVALALILGLAGTSWGLVRADRETKAARQAEAEALAQAERADREAEAANEVSTFLTDLFEVADPYKSRGEEVTARQMLDRGAERIETELEDQPLLRARLMHTIGDVYIMLGDFAASGAQLEQAVALREQHLGDHPDLAASLYRLGWAHLQMYHFQEAEPLFARSLQIREAKLGSEHLDVAESLNGLAHFARMSQDSRRAAHLWERVLAIRERELGPEHAETGKALFNLSRGYMFLGRYEEALELAGRYQRIIERDQGTTSLDLAAALWVRGNILLQLGRLDEAGSLLRQSLDIGRAQLPPGHPALNDVRNNLAKVLFAQERDKEAVAMLEQNIAEVDQASGPGAEAAVNGRIVVGNLLAEHDHLDQAIELYREALQHAHPSYPGYAYALLQHGELLHRNGDLREAEAQIVGAQEAFAVVYGQDAYQIAYAQAYLANIRRDQGRFEEAEALYQESFARLERSDHPARTKDLAEAAGYYAELLEATGREEEAKALREKYVIEKEQP